MLFFLSMSCSLTDDAEWRKERTEVCAEVHQARAEVERRVHAARTSAERYPHACEWLGELQSLENHLRNLQRRLLDVGRRRPAEASLTSVGLDLLDLPPRPVGLRDVSARCHSTTTSSFEAYRRELNLALAKPAAACRSLP